MKNLLLIILTSVTIQISAQEFATIGAKWHYTQATLNPEITEHIISHFLTRQIPYRIFTDYYATL